MPAPYRNPGKQAVFRSGLGWAIRLQLPMGRKFLPSIAEHPRYPGRTCCGPSRPLSGREARSSPATHARRTHLPSPAWSPGSTALVLRAPGPGAEHGRLCRAWPPVASAGKRERLTDIGHPLPAPQQCHAVWEASGQPFPDHVKLRSAGCGRCKTHRPQCRHSCFQAGKPHRQKFIREYSQRQRSIVVFRPAAAVELSPSLRTGRLA